MPPEPRAFRERLRALRTREAFRFPAEDVPAHYRRAAVLIPFWEQAGTVHVPLTRRSRQMSRHAGQIAFPGGLLEAGDTWEQAALREAGEEVGLDPEAVEVTGRLDDDWNGAESWIAPVVGLTADLLLEALAWVGGDGNDAAGARRLYDLRRYLAHRPSPAS